jgi:HEPN domain-containing protein
MKPATDPDVKEILDEADEDLADAADLARKAGAMGMYQAAQAAEKFLSALGVAAGRRPNPLWDIRKVFESLKEVPELQELAVVVPAIGLLAESSTPGKGVGDRVGETLKAARRVRAWVLVLLGALPREAVEEKEAGTGTEQKQKQEQEQEKEKEQEQAQKPQDDHPPSREFRDDRRPVAGRSERERGSSFVKLFLLCQQCGVRIPRTRQTARGRIPCPLCGRTMLLAE